MIEILHAEMLNWGSWARSWMPFLGIDEPPAFRDYRAGWVVPNDEPPVDEAAANRTDRILVRVPMAHWKVLKHVYLYKGYEPEEVLQAALRAYGDVRPVNCNGVLRCDFE